jgi:hypothetical protein
MLPFGGAKNRAAAGLSIALPLHTVCVVICCLDSGEKKKVYGHSWSFFETATPVTVARTIALNNLRPRNRLLIRGLWQNASIVFFDVVKDKALAELRIEKRTFTSSCCLADAAVERSGWTFGWQPATGWRACLCADSVILPGQDDSDRRRQRQPIGPLGPAVREAHAEAHCGQSEYDRSEYARCGRARGDELPLRNDQGRRTYVGDVSGRRRVNARKSFERLKRRQRPAQVLSERQ